MRGLHRLLDDCHQLFAQSPISDAAVSMRAQKPGPELLLE